jgi:hypothetical protein
MSLITISADLPNIGEILKKLDRARTGGAGALPYTAAAVKEATRDVIQRTWIQYAQGATVSFSGGTFRINSVSGAYVRSIEDGLRFPEDMTGEVFTTSPTGAIIESGSQPRDMKAKMLASPKARIGKDGKRFITIPFRHGTPGTVTMAPMPQHIYDAAKNLGYSRRNGELGSAAGTNRYTWGGKLGKSSEGQRSHSGAHPGAGYTWKTGQFSGMAKMGQSGHSQYMTFRRLSENSDPKAWQHPGVKPRPIREAVVENTREEVLALVRRGFEMDLYFMGLGEG